MHISLAPEVIFEIGSFHVTNTLIWSFVLSICLIIFIVFISKNLKQIPGKLQNLFEVLILEAYNFAKDIVGSKERTDKIFPLVFTIFIFILSANLATFVPGQGAFFVHHGEEELPLFRAIMSDYTLVFVLTLIVIFTSHFIFLVNHGFLKLLNKFIKFKAVKHSIKALFQKDLSFNDKIGKFFQGFLDFFFGIMELIGEISKTISLSFRLFGNMFAEEVLTVLVIVLAPFFAPLPFMVLGLLVCFVQPFVFSSLALITLSASFEEEGEEE